MSLIEQAAKRLEELRRAGADVPSAEHGPERLEPTMTTKPTVIELTEELKTARSGRPSEAANAAPAAPTPVPEMEEAHQSRHVHLDLGRLAAAGIVTPDAPRSHVADEFRVIKRPLIANATGKSATPIKNGNLIMVTSALPGEGKSFTAVNLAMSIAMELDHTVLLVDADVARPSLPALLGLPQGGGLLDVLVSSSVDLRDVLLRTDVEKLSILPSGSGHPRATELLASEAMNQLLDDMSRRYADRIIIFDSPPLLVTTEARVLATHMGQIVIVVEAEHTAQSAVKQAVAAVESCPIKLMMLNKGRSGATGSGYGYGYSYGYGYER